MLFPGGQLRWGLTAELTESAWISADYPGIEQMVAWQLV